MSVDNEHKVAKSKWGKWSEHARRVFNSVYTLMVNNDGLFVHPNAEVVSLQHFKTTAWNAAWAAADAVDEERQLMEREAAA